MVNKLYVTAEDAEPLVFDFGRISRLMLAPKFGESKGCAVGFQIIPPGIPHKIVNNGNGELRFVWIFSPPLPSQQRK